MSGLELLGYALVALAGAVTPSEPRAYIAAGLIFLGTVLVLVA